MKRTTNNPPQTGEHFHLLLKWMALRMGVFWDRSTGMARPPVDDPIINQFKFTNVYRLLDRTTQYLLRYVIYNGRDYSTQDMIWRILIFKHFNLPSTWELLIREHGDVTLSLGIQPIIDTLSRHQNRKYPIYSNAYMLTATFMKNETIKRKLGIENITRKHEAYMMLFQKYFIDEGRITRLTEAQSIEEMFHIVHEIPTVGGFLAYQYAQDWNYMPQFGYSQNDFVFAGPGTERGVKRVFKDSHHSPEDLVQWTHQNLETLMRTHGVYPDFKPLPGWWPQLPDVSNCLCEVDKYIRGLGIQENHVHGKRIKNFYKPSHRGEIRGYVFPPKWNIKLIEHV